MERRTAGAVMSPSAMPLAKLPMPEVLKPRYAMKKPMDADIAILRFFGMTRTIRSRSPNTVRATKTMPDTRVISIAEPKLIACDWIIAPRMKLEPIPVDSAKGRLV